MRGGPALGRKSQEGHLAKAHPGSLEHMFFLRAGMDLKATRGPASSATLSCCKPSRLSHRKGVGRYVPFDFRGRWRDGRWSLGLGEHQWLLKSYPVLVGCGVVVAPRAAFVCRHVFSTLGCDSLGGGVLYRTGRGAPTELYCML